MQGQQINVTDQLNDVGLSPEPLLQAALLCNSLRLASNAGELSVAVAQANGVLVGMRIGMVISEEQQEHLQVLFERVRQVTQTQHEVHAEQQSPVNQVTVTFLDGLPGPFDGPCIFLLDDGSIHAGEVVRNSAIFAAGSLSTLNTAGGINEKFEIPLRRVIGWADASPRDRNGLGK